MKKSHGVAWHLTCRLSTPVLRDKSVSIEAPRYREPVAGAFNTGTTKPSVSDKSTFDSYGELFCCQDER